MKRLKPGEVNLWQRRRYWEVFEREKAVEKARSEARFKVGIEIGKHLALVNLLSDLPSDTPESVKKLIEKKAGVCPDIRTLESKFGDEAYDRIAPASFKRFMEDGVKGMKVVRKDSHGPYKKSVFF